MTYNDVNWANKEAVTSAKLQQMADNEADLNARIFDAPRGILARSPTIKTNQTSTAVWWDIPGLTATATYEANRIIRASLVWRGIQPMGNTGIWAVQIQNRLNDGPYKVIAEAILALQDDQVIDGGGTLFAVGDSGGSPGTGVWKAALFNVYANGGGSMIWHASESGPSQLVVEDIGASV